MVLENKYISKATISLLFIKGLIWKAGSKSLISSIKPKLSLEKRRIAINSRIQVLGLNNVIAIGDIFFNKENQYSLTAQVAIQQGVATTKVVVMALRAGKNSEPFEYHDQGEMFSLGIANATFTSKGITLSGLLAFLIGRLKYLAKAPKWRLAFRSDSAWLLSI